MDLLAQQFTWVTKCYLMVGDSKVLDSKIELFYERKHTKVLGRKTYYWQPMHQIKPSVTYLLVP